MQIIFNKIKGINECNVLDDKILSLFFDMLPHMCITPYVIVGLVIILTLLTINLIISTLPEKVYMVLLDRKMSIISVLKVIILLCGLGLIMYIYIMKYILI